MHLYKYYHIQSMTSISLCYSQMEPKIIIAALQMILKSGYQTRKGENFTASLKRFKGIFASRCAHSVGLAFSR